MRLTATTPNDRRSNRVMRPSVAGLMIMASLLLTANALGQESANIAYVDMVRLFDNAPQLLAARESLDEEFRPRNEAVLADEARLESLNRQLEALADPLSERGQSLERESRNLRRSIERRREDLAQELRFRTNAEKQIIEDTIQIAIAQVAESGGYDLVLTGPVAYASERIDITELILDWLTADFEDDNRQLGARP